MFFRRLSLDSIVYSSRIANKQRRLRRKWLWWNANLRWTVRKQESFVAFRLSYLTDSSAFHEGDQIPAKVIPSKQACYVSHNGMEIFKPNYELLSGTGFTWVGSSNGHVPAGAVLAGNQATGEPLYVGRAHHEGALTPGKIHRGHGCLYIPYNGKEESILHYEVLVGQQRSKSKDFVFVSKFSTRCYSWMGSHIGSCPSASKCNLCWKRLRWFANVRWQMFPQWRSTSS